MRCPKCGKMLDDNVSICPVCNAFVRQADNGNKDSKSDEPIQLYQDEPIKQLLEHCEGGYDEPLPPPHKLEQKPKGKDKLIAVIASVAIVAAAAIAIPLLLNNGGKSDDASSAEIVDSGTCGEGDNVEWTIDDNGTLNITGSGKTKNYQKIDDFHSTSPFSDNKSIKQVKISDGITTIGSGLFWNTDSIKSVDIPKSVTVIDNWAFAGSEGFKDITIPNSVTTIGEFAFSWCGGLTELTLPKSVVFVGNFAFVACGNLKSVTIPESVTIIGYKAFGFEWAEDQVSNEKIPEFTIKGKSGSVAEQYAKDYGFTFEPI